MSMRTRMLALLGGMFLFALSSGPLGPRSSAQQTSAQTGGVPPRQTDMSKPVDNDPFSAGEASDQAARQAKLLANDRRKHILDDATKLITLSNELKAEVDKSTKDEMSLTVIRKAGEIEKLSHDLKERMKGN